MFEKYVRTDLAVEIQEDVGKENNMEGLDIHQFEDETHSLVKTHIKITNSTGAALLSKPIGNYITLESENLCMEDETIHMPFVLALHDVLKELMHDFSRFFVIGLGNRSITPDSLGPQVVDHLFITRHLLREGIVDKKTEISALSPGVMAQTGIEVGTIIKSVCEEIHPDVVICIDALAAKESKRLGTTIQICDTGITPGAGVGNRRLSLNQETLGVPVIAIGVPTVISIPSIIKDAMEEISDMYPEFLSDKYEHQLEQFIRKPSIESMFVSPKNIDETIRRISYTISEAINRFLT